MSNGTTRIAAARVKNNENLIIEAFRLCTTFHALPSLMHIYRLVF